MTSAISVSIGDESPADDEWQRLLETVLPAHSFLSAPWYEAWAHAFLPGERWRGPLRWVTARHTECGVTGIIPVARQRAAVISTMSLAGYYWPFRGIPFNSDLAGETAQAIAKWASTRFVRQVWRFGPVPRGNPAVESLVDAFSSMPGWTVLERQLGDTYAVSTGNEFRAYEHELANVIKKVAYYERRLKRIGNLQVREAVCGGELFLARGLNDLETIEARSWVAKDADGKPKFLGARNRRFWTALGENRAAAAAIRPMILYLAERPVSYSLNIDTGDTRYVVANGYDEEFHSSSPGMVLAYHVLRDACHSGRTIIEWGQGDSGYKSRWRAEEHLKLVDLMIVPTSLAGRILMQYLRNWAGYAELR